MKKLLYLILFAYCILIQNTIYAQNKLSGKIIDENNKPVALTSIRLTDDKQKTLVNMADIEGGFEFKNIKNGSYTLNFSYIGYQALDTVINITQSTELKIMLKAASTALGGVTITAQRPVVSVKPNGYSFGVQGSMLSTGKNANEILSLMPGVLVDADGNITLNGKSVLIMMDNKEIKLSAQQVTALLNGVRSENIQSVEAITNPGAAYDAEGIGGIIKIISKKQTQDGYSGSVGFTHKQWKYWNESMDAGINYKKNKLLLFANLSGSISKSFGGMNTHRVDNKNNTVVDIDMHGEKKPWSVVGRGGLQYDISSTSYIGGEVLYAKNYSESLIDKSYVNTSIYTSDVLQRVIKTTSMYPSTSDYNTLSASLNYMLATDKKGSNFKINADYLNPSSKDFSNKQNNYLNPQNVWLQTLKEQNTIEKENRIFSVKADRHSVFEKTKSSFDYGLKYSFADNDVNNLYENEANGIWITDKNMTNKFNYKENIAAAYTSYSNYYKKLKYVLGLRAEYTDMNGKSLESNIKPYQNSYFKLFPNISLMIPLDSLQRNSLTLNYVKRISRPGYEFLNPWVYKLDPTTIKRGNPYIKPTISHTISLGFNIQKKYDISLGYTYLKDMFAETQLQENGMTVQTFGNMEKIHRANLNFSTNLPLTKYWMTIIQAQGSYSWYNSANYDAQGFGSNITNINMFTVSPSFSLRLTTMYVSKMVDRYMQLDKAWLIMNLDAQKTLGKTGLQLKFGINDIFNARGDIRFTYNYPDVKTSIRTNMDSRVAYIGIVYNLKKGKAINKKAIEKSNIEEEERTK